MSLLRNISSGLRSLFRKEQVSQELEEELNGFLQMAAEEKMKQGMSRTDALRAVRLEHGNLEVTKDVVRSAGWESFVETCWRDLRFATQTLRKSPGFTVVAVLTLALGIGANSAIFSVVDAILLRPLPYPEPDRLVRVWESSVKYDSPRNVVNPLNFLDWHDQAQSFESMAAISSLTTNLSRNGQPIAVQGMQVTSEFFSVLRVPPFLGRPFNSSDGIAGQDHSVILSYKLWQHQFGEDRTIIGQKIDVDGLPCEVIGVMPENFSFPKINAEVWTPLPLARTEERGGGRFLVVAARLKPGVSIDQARRDMLRVADFTAKARPDYDKNWSASVYPMLEDATRGVSRPLWVLLASVGFLLLIACANVANLLLIRGTGRVREMAVRSALGAARSRIIQQLFIESLLLSATGMLVGLTFAHVGLRGLLALIPQTAPLPRSEPVSIDSRVLLFTFFASLLAAILFGLFQLFAFLACTFRTHSSKELFVAVVSGAIKLCAAVLSLQKSSSHFFFLSARDSCCAVSLTSSRSIRASTASICSRCTFGRRPRAMTTTSSAHNTSATSSPKSATLPGFKQSALRTSCHSPTGSPAPASLQPTSQHQLPRTRLRLNSLLSARAISPQWARLFRGAATLKNTTISAPLTSPSSITLL
jgi:putative ABC transport system permease protein